MKNKQENYFKKNKKDKTHVTYYSNNINLGKKGYIHLTNERTYQTKYFLIENIEFFNGLYIKADENTCITFKNCIFHKNICINSLGSITFEDNKYIEDATYPIFPEYFFSAKIKDLKFINENFFSSNISLNHNENIFGMNINTTFLTINDSLIKVRDNDGNIIINAKETIMFNSIVDGINVNIKSDNIYMYNSTILGEESVSIEDTNMEDSEIGIIESPVIVHNGEKAEKSKIFSL